MPSRLLGEFRIDVDAPVLEYLRAEQRTPLLPAVVVGYDASTPNEFASRSRSTLSMTEVRLTLTTRGLGSATLPNMHSRALRPPCIDRPLLLQVGADA